MLFIHIMSKAICPKHSNSCSPGCSDIDRVLLDGSLHLSPTELADPIMNWKGA